MADRKRSEPRAEMDRQLLKQRIIGALVLITLAVLILPILLEEREPEMLRESAIPVRPEPEPFGSFEPVQSQWASDENPEVWEEPAPIPDPEQEPTEPEPEPQLSAEPQFDTEGLPRAWVVQLATFSKQENAVGLVKRLQGAGYHAYSKAHRSSTGRMLQRVYVGPEMLSADAGKLRDRLENEFKMKGIVSEYQP